MLTEEQKQVIAERLAGRLIGNGVIVVSRAVTRALILSIMMEALDKLTQQEPKPNTTALDSLTPPVTFFV